MGLPDEDIVKRSKDMSWVEVPQPGIERAGLMDVIEEQNELLKQQNEELKTANQSNKESAQKSHKLNIFMAIMAGLSFLATIATIVITLCVQGK
jgi:hypothetical protein